MYLWIPAFVFPLQNPPPKSFRIWYFLNLLHCARSARKPHFPLRGASHRAYFRRRNPSCFETGAEGRNRTGDLLLRLHLFLLLTLQRGLDCIFLQKNFGDPCQSFGRLATPRSWPVQAINRYSGFTVLLPTQWAGIASHHGVALPSELLRLVKNSRRVAYFQSFFNFPMRDIKLY